MDWRKTEIIFIITFLLVDIFLGVVWFNKKLADNTDKLSSSSIQENLRNDHIKYPADLSEKSASGAIFTAEPYIFQTKELKELKDQSLTIQNQGTILHSQLKKPIPVDPKKDNPDLKQFIENHVYKGKSYAFWKYDEQAHELVYYQVMHKSPILFEKNAYVRFYLNNDNEVTSYEQTLLEKQNDLKEKNDLISASVALESIYQHGKLQQKSEIKAITFGYYTTVKLSTGNVYFPVWCFEIENKNVTEFLLVNAEDNQIINVTDMEQKGLEETKASGMLLPR